MMFWMERVERIKVPGGERRRILVTWLEANTTDMIEWLHLKGERFFTLVFDVTGIEIYRLSGCSQILWGTLEVYEEVGDFGLLTNGLIDRAQAFLNLRGQFAEVQRTFLSIF